MGDHTELRARFTAMHRLHRSAVRGWLRRSGVPERDIDDVAQEVWLSVWRRFGTCDHSRPSKPWLKTIAKRAARDFIRRASGRELLVGQGKLERTGSPCPTPEEEALSAQERAVLGTLLQE